MIIQQIYWQSVWGESIKKSKSGDSYYSHTKEEELTYKKMIERRDKKSRGQR